MFGDILSTKGVVVVDDDVFAPVGEGRRVEEEEEEDEEDEDEEEEDEAEDEEEQGRREVPGDSKEAPDIGWRTG